MERIAPEIIELLQYMLPGFLAAWVFHGLTSHPKASEFERIVQALIFTMFVLPLAYLLRQLLFFAGKLHSFGVLGEEGAMAVSAVAGIIVGLAAAYFANEDVLHRLCRKWKLTKETSYPSEWFGNFRDKITYVVLQLDDDRRLYGWPKEWPSDPTKGHFAMEDVGWVHDGSGEFKEITGVDTFLIGVERVKWVEFIKQSPETKNVQKGNESASPNNANGASGDQ